MRKEKGDLEAQVLRIRCERSKVGEEGEKSETVKSKKRSKRGSGF